MRKRKEYVKKQFESIGISSDTSANIYVSMLTSKAWIDLTKNAKVLYLYCKAQYYAEKKKPNNNSLQFTMNKSKWNSMYKIYTNQNQFYKDMGMLIEHGFIKCIENGSNTRTKNIYEFSSMWKNYGTSEFIITDRDRTIHNIRIKNKT